MAIERLGHVGPDNPELTFDRPRLERKGFLSIVSFRLDGRLQRELMDRGDAVAVLPIERRTRKLYMVRESRPLKSLASTEAGRAFLRSAGTDAAGESLRLDAGTSETWALPAGMIDRDAEGRETETPAETAVRELAEETGLIVEPARLTPVAPFYPSIGGCTERIHLFIAELSDPPARRPVPIDGGERLDVFRMDWDDAFSLVDQGLVETAASRILLLEFMRIARG